MIAPLVIKLCVHWIFVDPGRIVDSLFCITIVLKIPFGKHSMIDGRCLARHPRFAGWKRMGWLPVVCVFANMFAAARGFETTNSVLTKNVAAIVTVYRHNSHADVIVSRLLQTDTLDGKGKDSPLKLISLYTDQRPADDISRLLAASHRFRISHFTLLLHGIEQMILTGKPSWNVERTLLTSGTLDALLLSLKEGQRRVETPCLAVRYEPVWRWAEPPPPPRMRAWSEQ
jgi:hypothetical protein